MLKEISQCSITVPGLSTENILADFISCENISLYPSSLFQEILVTEVDPVSLGM